MMTQHVLNFISFQTEVGCILPLYPSAQQSFNVKKKIENIDFLYMYLQVCNRNGFLTKS